MAQQMSYLEIELPDMEFFKPVISYQNIFGPRNIKNTQTKLTNLWFKVASNLSRIK